VSDDAIEPREPVLRRQQHHPEKHHQRRSIHRRLRRFHRDQPGGEKRHRAKDRKPGAIQLERRNPADGKAEIGEGEEDEGEGVHGGGWVRRDMPRRGFST